MQNALRFGLKKKPAIRGGDKSLFILWIVQNI
jgi:hypothetical protein